MATRCHAETLRIAHLSRFKLAAATDASPFPVRYVYPVSPNQQLFEGKNS